MNMAAENPTSENVSAQVAETSTAQSIPSYGELNTFTKNTCTLVR